MVKLLLLNLSYWSDHITGTCFYKRCTLETVEARRNQHTDARSRTIVFPRKYNLAKGDLRKDGLNMATMGSPKDWKVYGDGVFIVAVTTVQRKLKEREGRQPIYLGKRGLTNCTGTVEPKKSKIHRNLYNSLLTINSFKIAYEEISKKKGANTRGATAGSLDGDSVGEIEKVINKLKDHSFQFKPTRRIYIPKKNGKLRPLGIPSPRDKVVQKIMTNILADIYEPKFLQCNHGFRPNKGTHTALRQIKS